MEITQESMNLLVREYSDTVLRVAYTYLKNKADAEDVMQDLFLNIIDKNPEFNDKKHEKLWIIRSTVNLCKNRVSSFWNKHKCSIDDVREMSVCDNYNKDSDVFKAVMDMPEKYRIAVYMFYYEGYSTAEISKITGKNDATVRSYLRRARERLKNVLKEEYDFE